MGVDDAVPVPLPFPRGIVALCTNGPPLLRASPAKECMDSVVCQMVMGGCQCRSFFGVGFSLERHAFYGARACWVLVG